MVRLLVFTPFTSSPLAPLRYRNLFYNRHFPSFSSRSACFSTTNSSSPRSCASQSIGKIDLSPEFAAKVQRELNESRSRSRFSFKWPSRWPFVSSWPLTRNLFVLSCAVTSLLGFVTIVYYLFIDGAQRAHRQAVTLMNSLPAVDKALGRPVVDISSAPRNVRCGETRRKQNGHTYLTCQFVVRGTRSEAEVVVELKRVRWQWVITALFFDVQRGWRRERVWICDKRAEILKEEVGQAQAQRAAVTPQARA